MSLNQIKNFSKKIKILLFNSPIILLILISFLSQSVNAQDISKNMTEIDLFVKAMNDYNETKLCLEDITKKMKTITLNIGLKIRLRELKRLFKEIETKFLNIQKEINKDIYRKEKIINDIGTLNIYMTKFKKKYNRANQVYYEFEELKSSIAQFLKLFFIILFICVIIVLCIIGISSFFLVKKQRKYYKLKEEVSFSSIQKQIIFNSNNINDKNDLQNNSGDKNISDKININMKNHYKNKNFVISQKTTEDLKDANNEIIRDQISNSGNKSSSKGELDQRK